MPDPTGEDHNPTPTYEERRRAWATALVQAMRMSLDPQLFTRTAPTNPTGGTTCPNVQTPPLSTSQDSSSSQPWQRWVT